MRPKPKFKVGQRVTYREDRRWRMVITERYWDSDYPSWRYRFSTPRLRKDLQDVWAPIEAQLLKVAARPAKP